MVLTFNDAVSRVCVDVETVDDAVVELDEVFTLSVTSSDSAVVFSNSQQTSVTILDNDGE